MCWSRQRACTSGPPTCVMEGYLRPRAKRAKAELTLVKGPRRLGEGLWSTGTMGRGTKEHGLILATQLGPALITGCAHPGTHRMAARATAVTEKRLRLVLGRFHLAGLSEEGFSAQSANWLKSPKLRPRAIVPEKVRRQPLLGRFPGAECSGWASLLSLVHKGSKSSNRLKFNAATRTEVKGIVEAFELGTDDQAEGLALAPLSKRAVQWIIRVGSRKGVV